MNIPPQFDLSHSQILQDFLDPPGNLEEAMTYSEAAGFLFVIACAPEMINPSEWLPLVLGESGFDDTQPERVQEIVGSLMCLYNELNRQVQESDVSLLPGCTFDEVTENNFEPDAPMSQWCQGFIAGQQWLEEMWDTYLPQELDEEFGAQLMVLSFFATKSTAAGLLAESNDPDKPFPEFAAGVLEYFPLAMDGFARMGGAIQTVLREQGPQAAQQPAQSNKVGRNEPCPCGSGKKYKKCCALKLH